MDICNFSICLWYSREQRILYLVCGVFWMLACNYYSLTCEELDFIYCHYLKKHITFFLNDFKISTDYILLLLKVIFGRNKGYKLLCYHCHLEFLIFFLYVIKEAINYFGLPNEKSSFVLTRL